MAKPQLILGNEGSTGHSLAATPCLCFATLLLLCAACIFLHISCAAFFPVSQKEILHFPLVELTLSQFILTAEMLSVCGQPQQALEDLEVLKA